MKNIFFILLFLSSNLIFAQDGCLNLIWADEFDYSGAPSSQNWGYDLGNNGWGNNEIQNYTSSTNNSFVENDVLTIRAIKTASNWTSARLKSIDKQTFKYGKIEFRAKLPEGSGTWPALWMLGANFPTVGWPNCGEIDIMEHVGKDPSVVHCALHTPSSHGGTVNTGEKVVPDYSTAFHNYAILWTEEFIKFFIDDVQYYVYAPSDKNASTWPFDQEFFFIMNIAMGGNWGSDPQYETNGIKNGIDPSLTEVEMQVDYIRVYELSGNPEISGQSFIEQNQSDLTYSVNEFPNSTYEWTVPEGVEIVSGENTNSITVNWNDQPGTVRVNIVGNIGCDENFTEIEVQFLETPIVGEPFIIDDFEDGNKDRWSAFATGGNSIEMIEEGGVFEVNYDIDDISSKPHMSIELKNPVDFSKHPILHCDVKANSGNQPQVIVYLTDVFGVQTNKTNYLLPVNSNGNFNSTDFDLSGKWISDNPTVGQLVDSSKINKIEFYFNAGKEQFFLDNIYMQFKDTDSGINLIEEKKIDIFPNPIKDIVHIYPKENLQIETIKVFDVKGKLLLQQKTKNNSPLIQMDLSALSNGVYILQLQGKDFVVDKKVWKE